MTTPFAQRLQATLDHVETIRADLVAQARPGVPVEQVEAFVAEEAELFLLDALADGAPRLFDLGLALGVIHYVVLPPVTADGTPEGQLLRLPTVVPHVGLAKLLRIAASPFAGFLDPETDDEAAMAAVVDTARSHLDVLDGWRRRFDRVLRGDVDLVGLSVVLTPDQLEVTGFDPPLAPAGASVTATLPLPSAGSPSVTVDHAGLRVALGATPSPGVARELLDVAGIVVSIPATPDAAASLRVDYAPEGPRMTARGGLDVRLPARFASRPDGSPALKGHARAELTATEGTYRLDVEELSVDVTELRLGGPDGLLVANARAVVSDLSLPGEPGRVPELALAASGEVRLGDSWVAVEARLARGRFALTSTAEVVLGEGITLGPIDDQPVLSFDVGLGPASEADVVTVAGRVELEQDGAEPVRVDLHGSLTVERFADGRLRVLDCAVAGGLAGWRPVDDLLVASAQVALSWTDARGFELAVGGSAGLLQREQPGLTGLEAFRLRIADVGVRVRFRADGFELALESGSVTFADPAFMQPGSAPSLAVDADEQLVLDVTLVPDVAFSAVGRLVVSGLGVAHGAFAATLTRAELVFGGSVPPTFEHVDAEVTLPVPSGELATFALADGAWDLDGLPLGSIQNAQRLALLGGGGFELSLVGDEGSPSSIGLLPDGDDVVLELSGLARLALPADVLQRDVSDPRAGTDGAEIHLDAAGSLRVPLTSAGPWTFDGLSLGFSTPGARWRLGGDDEDALLLVEPWLSVGGLEHLLAPSSDDPFTLQLGGTIQMGQGGPGLLLSGAGFDVVSWEQPPVFRFGEIGVLLPEDGDETGVELVPAGPFRLERFVFGSRAWIDDGVALPLPDVLAPENLVIRCTVELAMPVGENGSAGFRADDVELRLVGTGGLPTISLDGLGFGVQDLTIHPALKVSGALHVGGLKHLFPADDRPPDPSLVFAAGKLGAIVQGTGAQILLAADLFPPRPLGACLEVKLSQGIQIAYGFVLTGVSGGISYANTNADPCEIRAYVQLPDDGPPVRVQEPAPSQPPAAALAAGDPMPTERPARGGDRPGCPGPCPPPSMNLLCQPHPDVASYPGRAILKFSSLDRAFLDRVVVEGRSAREWIDTAQGSAEDVVATLVDRIELSVSELLPDLEVDAALLATLPGPFATILEDPVGYMGSQLRVALVAALQQATGGAPLSALVEQTLHRGIDCPDSTLQLTGSFSYTGLSTFLSITGGVNVSTAGSAGVLGSVDVFGIPVGTARLFVTGTSATGGVQPGFCGDIKATLGPLELGQLALAATAPELGEGQLEALVMTLAELVDTAPGLVTELLAATDPPLWGEGEATDADALAARVDAIVGLPGEERATAVATLLCRLLDQQLEVVAGVAPTVAEAVERLARRLWERTNPSITMCGVVAPKLFGLPLSGELLGVASWMTKERVGAELRFSPSHLLGRVFPPADFFAGFDQAVLGFDLAFPDPFDLVAVQPFLDDGVAALLDEATFAVSCTLSPLGLELATVQARVVMPRLEDHPAARVDGWTRPEDRRPDAPADQQLPSRSEVLIAALDDRRLGGVTWKGELDELTIPGRAPLTGLRLREDYFPHGGLVGAGRLVLPRILTEGVPSDLWRDVVAPEDPDPLARVSRAFELLTDYVLETDGVGQLAFYVPAPNPPLLLDEHGEAPSAAELVGSLNGLDPGALTPGPLFAAEEAFLGGRLDAKLLGLPIGEARIEARPPTPDGGEGLFEITAATAPDSWLSALVGEVELTFRVRRPPPLPIAAFFEAFTTVARATSDATLASSSTVVDEAVEHVMAGLLQQATALGAVLAEDAGFVGPVGLPGAEMPRADLPSAGVAAETVSGLRAALEQLRDALAGRRGSARAEALVAQLVAALASQLPKVSLEVEVEVRSPERYGDLLSFEGSARLLAFSPGHGDPAAPPSVAASLGTGRSVAAAAGRGGAGVVGRRLPIVVASGIAQEATVAGRVRRQGGAMLEVEDLRVQAGPFGAQVDLARLALVPVEDGIALDGRAAVTAFVDDGTSEAWSLLDASLVFAVEPTPAVTLHATSAGFSLGPVEVDPLDPGGELELEVSTEPLQVRVSPARLTIGALGIESEIVVPEPFTLRFGGDWSVTVEVRRLLVPHPLDPAAVPLVDVEDLVGGTLAMTDGVLTLEVPAAGTGPITVPALPLVPLAPITSSGELERLFVAADGRLDLHGRQTLELLGGLATATGRLDLVVGDVAAVADGGASPSSSAVRRPGRVDGTATSRDPATLVIEGVHTTRLTDVGQPSGTPAGGSGSRVTGSASPLAGARAPVDLSDEATRRAAGVAGTVSLRAMEVVRGSSERVRDARTAVAVRRLTDDGGPPSRRSATPSRGSTSPTARAASSSGDRAAAEDALIRAAVARRPSASGTALPSGVGAVRRHDGRRDAAVHAATTGPTRARVPSVPERATDAVVTARADAVRRIVDAQRELAERARRTRRTSFSFTLSEASVTLPRLARIEGGGLVLDGEPLVDDAELTIDATGVRGSLDLGQRWLGVPLLAEVRAGAWELDARFDEGTVALRSASSSTFRLLGRPAASASVDVVLGPDGGVLTARPEEPVVVIPSLLRMSVDRVELRWTVDPHAVDLSARAVLEVLDLGNDALRFERDVDLGTGDAELALLTLPSGFLASLGLDAPWLEAASSPKLAITRDDEDALELELRDLRTSFPGVQGTFSGVISSSGVVEATLDELVLATSLLAVELDGAPTVRFDVLPPFQAPRVVLPGGKISSATIPGFPDVAFDGFEATDGELAFTARLDGATYAGSFPVGWPLGRISYELAAPTLAVTVSGTSISARIEPGGVEAWTAWRCPGSDVPFATASFEAGAATVDATGRCRFTLPASAWTICDVALPSPAIAAAERLLRDAFTVTLKVDDLF